MKFSDLALIDQLQQAIKETGYDTPTPIQQKAIPVLLEGRDLLGCAQTGTGKTAAFALPILQGLFLNRKKVPPKHTRALILSPTRELTIQIHESIKTYGKHLPLTSAVIFGGVGQVPQVHAVARGVDIVVATPGRLMDLISQRHLSLRELEIFVLDEADRMLDMGFIHDIRKIIAMLPKERQNLFFSATLPPDITKLSQTILNDPVRVEVAPVSSTAELIAQSVMFVESTQKLSLLIHLLKQKEFKRVIVFTRMKHGANRIAQGLEKAGIGAEAIHGNKSQNARQRALENFRDGKTRVLIATDIAARGIDIDNISHVINYELPNVSESYVHRIGRTARAGASGLAISFSNGEERAYLRDIEKLIGKVIPVDTEHPFHSESVAHAKVMSKGKAKEAIEGPRRGSGGGRGPSRRPNGGPASGPGGGGRKSFGARGAGPSGPARGPSTGPSSGPSRGPSSGPSAGTSRGPSAGPSRGPSGPSRGPSRPGSRDSSR